MSDTIYNPSIRETRAVSDTVYPPLVSESRKRMAQELRRMARAIRAMEPIADSPKGYDFDN